MCGSSGEQHRRQWGEQLHEGVETAAAHQLRFPERLPPRVAGRPQEVDVADARHLQARAAWLVQLPKRTSEEPQEHLQRIHLAAGQPRLRLCILLCLTIHQLIPGCLRRADGTGMADWEQLNSPPHPTVMLLRCFPTGSHTSTGDWKLMNSPARALSSGSSSSRSCPLYVALPPVTS
jgi:hypothetical protein